MQPDHWTTACRKFALPGNDTGVCEALRLIEDKLAVGGWTWDLATGDTYWTPGLYKLLDLDAAAVQPSRETFESVMHPADLRLAHDFNKALADGMPFDRQFRILHRNGSVRWVHNISEVLVDRNGVAQRAVGVVQDVTEQYEALQSEQTWRDRYKALVRAVKSPVWTSRPDDPYTIEVENLENLPGPTKDQTQFIGYAWKQTIHPDDMEMILRAWDNAYKTKQPFEFEKRVRLPDGSYRWARSRVVPILNQDGSVRGWIGTSVDIQQERDWSAPSPRALTGAQIRSARGLLNWSVRDLADRAGVSPAVIRRLEERDDAPCEAEPANAPLKAAFEQGGVEFLFPAVGKPGIRPA
jgi:PAS domain S-box-containing protein